jgi:putative Mn2+ efflux pump MntP
MDIQARYLLFHSVVVLVAGLLVGVPLGRAVHRNASDQVIKAWRLAHDTLTVGPTLTLAIAALLSSLSVGASIKSWLAWTWVAANYGFCFSLPLSAMVEQRGHTLEKPLSNQLVFIGNLVGIVASSVGTAVLLYAAYRSLP